VYRVPLGMMCRGLTRGSLKPLDDGPLGPDEPAHVLPSDAHLACTGGETEGHTIGEIESVTAECDLLCSVTLHTPVPLCPLHPSVHQCDRYRYAHVVSPSRHLADNKGDSAAQRCAVLPWGTRTECGHEQLNEVISSVPSAVCRSE